LYRIAYNTFYDYARARATVASTPLSHRSSRSLSGVETPENGSRSLSGAEGNNTDFNMDFQQALSTLKNDERTAMLLFFMEDQTVEKISKIMNCPVNTVKSHLHRGKEKISKYFK